MKHPISLLLIRRVVFILIVFGGSISHSWSQHQEVPEKPRMWKGRSKSFYDTGAIAKAFQAGTVQGHFRYFFMNTNNEGPLSDYFAHAGGGGIRFETAPYHGLQFAVSGFYIFNLHSSDLSQIDTLASNGNRYEIGLFDLQDPHNKKDLDRLEEFYLKYGKGESYLSLGRQLINTPFINLQDGRMRPTGVEGVWFNILEIPKTKIEGGYLWAISPRSTVRWYYMGESLGTYGVGVNEQGRRSQYAGQTESHYVATLGVHRDLGKHRVHLWNFHADNLFNSTLFQGDFEFPASGGSFIIGIQAIRQFGLGNGGNDSSHLRYINPESRASVFSGRLGWKDPLQNLSLNYTRITKEGRYLMPREWGRDPFYTFMPRERNEGMGDVHALMLKYQRKLPLENTQSSASVGHFKLPAINNFALNKYGFPSYVQANLDLRHQFGGAWQGLEAQLLLVQKWSLPTEFNDPRFVFNKVNVTNVNMVLNYYF